MNDIFYKKKCPHFFEQDAALLLFAKKLGNI